jgi:hypothetical protein
MAMGFASPFCLGPSGLGGADGLSLDAIIA